MTAVFANRIKEISTTQGTGTINLAGASSGFESFVAGIGDGNETYYLITDGVDWEIGIGTVTDASPDTLSRDIVEASSNGDALVNWSAGTRDVFGAVPTAQLMNELYEGRSTYYADSGAADAYVIAPSPAIQARTAGLTFAVKIGAGNDSTGVSGGPTLNDGIGSQTIINVDGTTVAAGEIQGGGVHLFAWDGTNYQLLNPRRAGGISNLVEDISPQLGGDLDLNGFNLDFPSTPNISDVLDEDDLSSNSATALATQQSIKAYVDTEVAGASVIDQVARNRINNLAFRVASLNSLAVFEMTDMLLDAFEDETGVEVNGGATYDASGDFYGRGASEVAGGTGTPIGDMTNGGGLAAAFDGTTNQAESACARILAINVGYVGKDWGVGNAKIISALTVYSSNDEGFAVSVSGTPTINLALYGSNSAPSNSTDGTLLDSWTETDGSITITSSRTSATITTTTAYRYHWIRVEDTRGDINQNMVVAEIVFTEAAVDEIVLISDEYTADAAPDTARVTIWHEAVDSVTINTDAITYASRAGAAFTTDYATDANQIDDVAHGLSDDDRVAVFSTGTLPAGLSEGVLYYVVNSTTDAFEVSLTSGGAAVTLTDDGTGTHTWAVFDAVTLAEDVAYDADVTIYAADVDISGQPSGTAMRWAFATANNKEQRLHGFSLSWR